MEHVTVILLDMHGKFLYYPYIKSTKNK